MIEFLYILYLIAHTWAVWEMDMYMKQVVTKNITSHYIVFDNSQDWLVTTDKEEACIANSILETVTCEYACIDLITQYLSKS